MQKHNVSLQDRERTIESFKSDDLPQAIVRNFSRAAPHYQRYAQLQLGIAKKLADNLVPSLRALRILELGCGTGFLSRELLRKYPRAHIDAIDIAPGMIEQAQAIFDGEQRISWKVGDARCYNEHLGAYDCIVSSSAFHWMPPFSELFGNVRKLLAPDGLLIFSLMLDGTLGELHRIREEIAPKKGKSSFLPTEIELRDTLEAHGFVIRQAAIEKESMLYPSTDALLRSIRDLGLAGSIGLLEKSPLNRSELRMLLREYQRRFGNEHGSVAPRFVVGYYEASVKRTANEKH